MKNKIQKYSPLIIFILVCSILMVVFYYLRVDQTFSKARDDTKNSIILNKTLGKIEKVKYNNYLIWLTEKKGYECVPMKVYTKDKKYKVCVILNEENYLEIPIGYVIDNKIYMEEDN